MEDLNGMAEKVREATKAMNEAIVDERVQGSIVLRAMAEQVSPGLPGMCSRIPSTERGRIGGAKVETEWHPQRGVLLVGNPTPRLTLLGQTKSDATLYLLEDGSFAVAERVGVMGDDEWSWSSTLRVLTPREVLEHPARFALVAIAQNLASELEAQLEGKAKATAKIRKATDRLRAIATLLGAS